jgi:glycosyltransferase involved in cell wall biosynthesis
MKILIVCSKNSGKVSPFIMEQAGSLERKGLVVDFFTIEGKGTRGYLNNYGLLVNKIKNFRPDIIHAHYGLSGLLANLQRRVPVVTTYHGSDINEPKVYPFSRFNMLLSAYNIFVSETTKSSNGDDNSLIPCGIDIELFKPNDKIEARMALNLDADKKYILFSGAFDNRVKNAVLAQKAVSLVSDVTLLELKGYSRQEVVLLMNAVDMVLMTSFTEGSPQFIKESMACNCPIVSVPAGDVAFVINQVEGCCLTTYEAVDVAENIKMALDFGFRTNGRERIMELKLDLDSVAEQILEVYLKVLSRQ